MDHIVPEVGKFYYCARHLYDNVRDPDRAYSGLWITHVTKVVLDAEYFRGDDLWLDGHDFDTDVESQFNDIERLATDAEVKEFLLRTAVK